jgi:hypothetical protein
MLHDSTQMNTEIDVMYCTDWFGFIGVGRLDDRGFDCCW